MKVIIEKEQGKLVYENVISSVSERGKLPNKNFDQPLVRLIREDDSPILIGFFKNISARDQARSQIRNTLGYEGETILSFNRYFRKDYEYLKSQIMYDLALNISDFIDMCSEEQLHLIIQEQRKFHERERVGRRLKLTNLLDKDLSGFIYIGTAMENIVGHLVEPHLIDMGITPSLLFNTLIFKHESRS